MVAQTARTGTEWLRSQSRKVSDGPELPVSATTAASVEVEAWLQRHGVQYAPPTHIPMGLIDEKRSRGNQARKDAIVADSVERYATAMRSGAKFPPIVCYPLGGRLVIIDGNNRQAAARKANHDTIFGIVIAEDTPSELIQLLTVEANAHHGLTPDMSWRLQQAFHLCSIGFTDQAAAEAASISIAQLRNARAARDADQRARALKVHGFADISQAAKQALSALKDDAVFYQAAKLAVDTSMTSEEIREMTRAVKTQGSEGARIEYIGQLARTRGIERATKRALSKTLARVSSPKHSLVTAVGKILAIDPAALVRQVVTTTDRDLLDQRLRDLQKKLIAIQVAMTTLNFEDEA